MKVQEKSVDTTQHEIDLLLEFAEIQIGYLPPYMQLAYYNKHKEIEDANLNKHEVFKFVELLMKQYL